MELHPDGTKSTLKPSLMSLGRVTVIRGKGILAGIPFMDEYVVARDKVCSTGRHVVKVMEARFHLSMGYLRESV